MNRRILLYQDYCDQSYPTELETLPETGVLANHSSDFMLPKQTHSQPAFHATQMDTQPTFRTNRPDYGGRTAT